ncbi:hypothetical protein BABINDRAFT_162275 [Babjeviella inositovora NRRL Y-12698]|uniref:Chromatin modification-related protein EAF3 n=1 Tax=Babjeviella inositovora NRRL Y-12698 TaxID=984486 RepID=A0A1E3QNM2_9ASCO|nr:uncharacterized protein BABINDRAFT_162275 [Babjeviella inositovora NRRL Y-12698]ODQ79238.1 hypothetical protein BABINDRAFT_162275 [Babjeviella inositovora NRRL Y-12698]
MSYPKATPTPIKINTRCLAYHGPLLYEAKVLKLHQADKTYIETKEGQTPIAKSDLPPQFHKQTSYYLHYNGWKKTWDEWVDTTRVLEINPENLGIQKDLRRAAIEAARVEKRSKTDSTSVSSAGRGLKRGASTGNSSANGSASSSQEPSKKRARTTADPTLETEDEFLKRPEVQIAVPNKIKKILVDDWESVTKNHKLLLLPAEHSVDSILTDYKNHQKEKLEKARRGKHDRANTNPLLDYDLIEETISGLKLYFNRSIGVILLYRFERQLYLKESKKLQGKKKGTVAKEFSSIYGGEHLLRLLVSMPGLVAQTSMDAQSISILVRHLEDFLEYLESRAGDYFDPARNYEHASPAYIALAKAT